MKLLGHSAAPNHIQIFRDLEVSEVASHLKFTPIVAEARNRFNLFRILVENYTEWRSFLDSLLSIKPEQNKDEMLELDRLLLNYLTCAYTIQEHFKVSFQRRFRKDTAKQKDYAEFLDKLCATSWPFAFFLDFRSHVQHCGLGIGEFHRNVSATSVVLNVTHDATKLLEENKDWPRSKLTGKEGNLDLVTLLEEFHLRMLQHYAVYVAKTFLPEIFPAAEFYGRLTEEIHRASSDFRMVFHEEDIATKTEGDKHTLRLQLSFVPNDLFAELGIKVTLKS